MKKDYIQLVAQASGKSLEETEQVMSQMKTLYNVSYKEYYGQKFYAMSPTFAIRNAKKIKMRKDAFQKSYSSIIAATGLTKAEILEEIKRINTKGIFKVNALIYEKWELYRYNEEELDYCLQLLKERNELKISVDQKRRIIDNGEMGYESLDSDIRKCSVITEKLMGEALKNGIYEVIKKVRPELTENKTVWESIAIDMEVTRFLLGYSLSEYCYFQFFDKNVEERCEFLSYRERMGVLRKLNDLESCELIGNKHLCYINLKKYFRRKQVCINSVDDYAIFKQFCKGLKIFVKKPMAAEMGKGVEPVSIDKKTDLRALMRTLLEENGPFVAEELIKMHRHMRKLNPYSVNTVRVETYYNGGSPVISAVFMRIGRAGSFVDNGSAGGMMVSVDPKTGIVLTSACDHHSNRYERHPDTNVRIEGFKLPHWKRAIKVAKRMAKEIPQVQYVGWDLTCNSLGKWVIVEGNTKPQGHQISLCKGIRKSFFETLGKNPNEFK